MQKKKIAIIQNANLPVPLPGTERTTQADAGYESPRILLPKDSRGGSKNCAELQNASLAHTFHILISLLRLIY